MRSRRHKGFFVAFALLMNLGGGPMAWAHLLGAGNTCHPASPVLEMAEDCPGHHAQAPDNRSPERHAPPCCEGGHCACAAPALAVAVISPTARLPHAPAPTAALPRLPATPFENALRPPIR